MSSSLPLKAILFDLDGTLIDSSPGLVSSINAVLKAVGSPGRQPDEIKTWIGYPLSVMFPHFTDAPYQKLYELFLEQADLEVAESTTEIPGASAVLEHFHQLGYRMGIVSTKRRLHIDQVLDRLSWRPYFEILVGGDDVHHVKPNTEPFERALQLLGLSAGQAIVVGDTENDIRPAVALGIHAIAVKSIFHSDGTAWSPLLLASSPDELLEELTELPEVVARLEGNDAQRAAF